MWVGTTLAMRSTRNMSSSLAELLPQMTLAPEREDDWIKAAVFHESPSPVATKEYSPSL